MPAHATRVDQEGHIVSPMPAVHEGVWLDGFLDPFLAATRTPAERLGDLSAQMGANKAGARRIEELVVDLDDRLRLPDLVEVLEQQPDDLDLISELALRHAVLGQVDAVIRHFSADRPKFLL